MGGATVAEPTAVVGHQHIAQRELHGTEPQVVDPLREIEQRPPPPGVALDDIQRDKQMGNVVHVADRADTHAGVSKLLDGPLVACHPSGAVERHRDMTVRWRRRKVLDPGSVLDAHLDTQTELLISTRDHLLLFPLSMTAAGCRGVPRPTSEAHSVGTALHCAPIGSIGHGPSVAGLE
jgi:hypothetical protein